MLIFTILYVPSQLALASLLRSLQRGEYQTVELTIFISHIYRAMSMKYSMLILVPTLALDAYSHADARTSLYKLVVIHARSERGSASCIHCCQIGNEKVGGNGVRRDE